MKLFCKRLFLLCHQCSVTQIQTVTPQVQMLRSVVATIIGFVSDYFLASALPDDFSKAGIEAYVTRIGTLIKEVKI